MLLLGIVGGHVGNSPDEVDWGLAPEGLLGFASVCFLVFVKHYLTSLQDNTEFLPGSGNKINIRVRIMILQMIVRLIGNVFT